MGKKKKQHSELDAILEQLKRSYVSDSDAELEDALLDDEESEEDSELSSILAKIFSDEDDIEKPSAALTDDKAVEDSHDAPDIEQIITADSELEPPTTADVEAITYNTEEDIKEQNKTVEEHIEADEAIDIQEETIEPITEEKTDADDEQQKVDDVLNTMLRGAATSGNTDDEASDSPHSVIEDIAMAQSENPDNLEQVDEAYGTLMDSSDEDVAVDTYSDEDDTTLVNGSEQQSSLTDDIQDKEEQYPALSDAEINYDEYIHDECEVEPEQEIPAPRIVLDPDEYTPDPLQLSIIDLNPIKFEEDLADTETTVSSKQDTAPKSAESIIIDRDDVSLLVKFGYAEEVNSQIGREQAKKAFFEKEKDFMPEAHRTPFGFTGKEFSDKSQADQIRKKYKSDIFNLLAMLISLGAFTVISFITGIMFEFSPEKSTYYLPIMAFDFLLVATSALICIKRMMSGAIAVSRFEANAYSILLITGAEYILYNILSSFIYVVNSNSSSNSFAWISGCYVLIYFSVVILCDFLNCDKEAKTFELMVNCDTIYTAEKLLHIQEDDGISRSGGYTNTPQGTFRVRKTSMIGGYFKKTSNYDTKLVSPIYMLGIVPSIALILSCCAAIITESASYGIQSFMMISILCMPLPCVCLGTVLAFIKSRRQINSNVAFVGQNSENEFASASLLVFDDTDAIEISSYKEINPGKNIGDLQQQLSIAYDVLNMLDGPLGQLVPQRHISKDGHELIINSVADNGINIYFDSSSNILIGDRQYMLANNLKVKTDVNLTTATKGADRCVIYMAFDGKPQLGFVLTCKVKPDFLKITSILNTCRIAIYIESYEPEVNDVYFEQNKISDLISVHKPSKYQKKSHDAITDSSVIAKDALSLTRAISECKDAPTRRKRIKNSNLISIIIGAMLSVLIVLLICMDNPVKIIDILRDHPTITVYLSMIISSIPAIIITIKELKRK